MSEFQISTRYAAALMDIAEEKGIEEKVAEDIGVLYKTLFHSRELRTILASPVIKPVKKENILKELFQNRVDEIIFNFILLVVEKNREEILFDITKRFIELRDKKYGFANAEIKSTVDMTDPQKKELLEKLENYFQKKIRATFTLDQNLIGGFVVRVGDTVINTSVKRKLELLKMKFLEESFLNN